MTRNFDACEACCVPQRAHIGELFFFGLGYEDGWLDLLYGDAQNQILGCWVHGGRYWEVLVDLPELFRNMRRGIGRSRFLRGISSWLLGTENSLNTIEDLPKVMRLSVCAPQVCNEDLLVENIFQKAYAPKFMGPRPERNLANVSFKGFVNVEELFDWSSFEIDFAITGVNGCGSTSLNHNLNRHPEVVFSTMRVDAVFTASLAHRLLPLRSQVESFNQKLEVIKEEKWRSSGVKPRLIGICNPSLFANGLARRKLAGMPNLKILLILCDPVGRLEKNFMSYLYCFDSVKDAKERGLAGDRGGNELCFESASALLTERLGKLKGFWDAQGIAAHMPRLENLFSGRMRIVHQEELRNDPKVAFESLMDFLEAKTSFPPDTSFPRYNAVGGHRTDLCHNASLLSALKLLLEPEYQMQELLLQNVSIPRLRSRETRCERMEENRDHCPLTAACQ